MINEKKSLVYYFIYDINMSIFYFIIIYLLDNFTKYIYNIKESKNILIFLIVTLFSLFILGDFIKKHLITDVIKDSKYSKPFFRIISIIFSVLIVCIFIIFFGAIFIKF